MGVTLSLARRIELLQAAEQSDAWILEDDYDGEFRYHRTPLPTLQSLDTTERVIYVGTFSKSLFPALRLGYFVAPSILVDTFRKISGAFLQGAPSNLQRSEEHTSELQSLMRISYAVFCLKKKNK